MLLIPNTPIAPPRLASESEEAEEELQSLNSQAFTVREDWGFEEEIAPLGFPIAFIQVQEVKVYSADKGRETVSVPKEISVQSGSH